MSWRVCAGRVASRPATATSSGRAVLALQRAWRCYTNRQIFHYFRDMIRFREEGDPAELLRCINPKEAHMMDAAAKIHVRFRLGGSMFPPTIYYKIYTHGAVTDVNAFAPRDYTAHFQAPPVVLHNKEKAGDRVRAENRENWYRRFENNGWRPISDKILEEPDAALLSGAARTTEWHHVKTKRREEAVRQRKQKKLKWLQHMYALGKAEGGTESGDSGGGAAAVLSAGGSMAEEAEAEAELTALLQWSDSLDFDSYYQDWLTLATSAKPSWQGTGAGVAN